MSEKFGSLKGLKLAYVGDGNNMAHSLMYGGPKCGVDVAVATPKGYEPDTGVTANARADAAANWPMVLIKSRREAGGLPVFCRQESPPQNNSQEVPPSKEILCKSYIGLSALSNST